MPAYYFHVFDNGTLVRDPDGIELPDLQGARGEIRKLLRSVLQEEYTTEDSADREFRIEDAFGRVLLVIPFRLARTSTVVAG